MAKRSRQQRNTSGSSSDDVRELVRAHSLAQLVTGLVDRIGWPGVLVFLIFFAMQFWSTSEQKAEFVGMYILGKGILNVWPIVVLGVIFLATVLAQHRIYDKKIALLKGELRRVGDEKSSLQQELTDRRLERSGRPASSPLAEGTHDADRDH